MIADESLIERIRLFLIDNPGSTALQIASALNQSRQRVSSAILQNNVISPRDLHEKPARFVISAPVSDNSSLPAPSTYSEPTSLESAVGALFDPLANSIRNRIEVDLSRILHDEIAKAIDTIGQNTISRLCDHLCFDPNGSAAKRPDPAPQSVASQPAKRSIDAPPIVAPLPLIPPMKRFEAVTVLDKFSSPVPAQPSTCFTNPKGAPFVPNDKVSKRTAHKETAVPKDTPAPITVTAQKPARRPKMIVIGLKPNQQELIKREFKDRFDLRMFVADQLTFIKKAINIGDDVICMAEFISHSHTDVVSARGGNMAVVHGGMHSLRDELSERLEKVGAAA